MTELSYEIIGEAMIGRAFRVETEHRDAWLSGLNAIERITAIVLHEITVGERDKIVAAHSYLLASVSGEVMGSSFSAGLFIADAIRSAANGMPFELIGGAVICLDVAVDAVHKYEWLKALNKVMHITAGVTDALAEDEDLTRISLSLPGEFKSHSVSGGLYLKDAVESAAKHAVSAS